MDSVVASDGTRIAYRTVGDGPDVLLFLHPWGASGTGRFWNLLLEELDLTTRRIVLPDLRGHGHSAPSSTGYGVAQLASDTIAVLDEVGAREVILVGHSVGSRIAQYLAATQPERVRGQVLFAPVPASELPLSDEVLATWLECARDREKWAALMAQFTKDPPTPAIIDAYFDDLTLAARPGLAGLFDLCRRDGFAEALASIAAPTLLVVGTHDRAFPFPLVKTQIQEKITGARLVEIDAGHEIPLERPREATALLERFC